MVSKNKEKFIRVDNIDEYFDNLDKNITWRDKVKYWVLGKWNKIRLLPREIKWKIQRIKHGYSDCDVWGFDYYLLDILVGGLSRLRDHRISYPGDDITYDEWTGILGDMVEGFKIGRELIDMDKFPYREDISNCDEYFLEKMLTKEEQEKHDKAFDLLKEWFYNLWD